MHINFEPVGRERTYTSMCRCAWSTCINRSSQFCCRPIRGSVSSEPSKVQEGTQSLLDIDQHCVTRHAAHIDADLYGREVGKVVRQPDSDLRKPVVIEYSND